jgi:hypothetical protein
VLDKTATRVYNVFRGIPSLLPNRPILLDIVETLARQARSEDVADEKRRFDALWNAAHREMRDAREPDGARSPHRAACDIDQT